MDLGADNMGRWLDGFKDKVNIITSSTFKLPTLPGFLALLCSLFVFQAHHLTAVQRMPTILEQGWEIEATASKGINIQELEEVSNESER